MGNFKRLILAVLIGCFSQTCLADDEQFSISFSISDYERSKLTGEAIKLQQVPFSVGSDGLTPFIIGGKNASRNEYPEFALVLISNGVDKFIGSCGGTLIANNKVLTAAHCAGAPADRYFVIPNFYSYNDQFFFEDFFPASSVVIHPDYDDRNLDYDMAVITLNKNAFTAAASIHAGTNQFEGDDATVIGTGRTQTSPAEYSNILQEVDVPVVSNQICQDFYEALPNDGSPALEITPRMMCTGYETDGRGACFGDSGGPLLMDIDDQRVQVGVVSFGVGPCEANRRSNGYARVSAFTEFLMNQSPRTNFVFSDEVPITLASVYDLLLGELEPVIPVGPPEQFPVIEAFSGTFRILLESDYGESIGQGQSYAYDQSNTNVSVTVSNDDTINIEIDGWGESKGAYREIDNWRWSMQVASNRTLSAGAFHNATGYPGNGLSFRGNGRSCNRNGGRFKIFEIEYSGTEVTKLVADFRQYCSAPSFPKLRGSIYYDANKTPLVLTTKAITNEQPDPPLAPLNSLSAAIKIESEVLQMVGRGENYLFTSANSAISVTDYYGDPRAVHLIITDSTTTRWELRIMRSTLEANPDHDKPLSRGIYNNAIGSSRHEPEAGLRFTGDGYCDSPRGQFRIFDIVYDANGEIEVLKADFRQYCRPYFTPIRGSINYDNR